MTQIAWSDRWDGGVGETVWERNATFPVVLDLVSYDGLMRITRQPIEDIAKLYQGDPMESENIILREGENILEDVDFKTFDMTAVFDLNDTEATSIEFHIAQINFSYDVVNE